jgi:hypothetical protein
MLVGLFCYVYKWNITGSVPLSRAADKLLVPTAKSYPVVGV